MLSGIVPHIHKARYLLEDHSTTILTAAGVGGTVATAVLTGRASFKAARIIDEEQEKNSEFGLHDLEDGNAIQYQKELSKTEKTKLVWRLYLPPVASGVLTITCIIVANKISSKKIAALAVAGGISERALQEYKEKVVEKFGERKDTDIRDEIAQDRVNKNAQGAEQIILAGSGQVLCYDMTTGRYFQSTMEEIKSAENKVNYELLHHMSCSLAEFHDEIGLRPTSYTDSVGWSGGGEMFKVIFSTVMSPDGRPCIAIDFAHPPILEYSRYHG